MFVTQIFSIGGGLRLVSRKVIKAVESVSLAIPSDKPVNVALVGESGSGKTTISRMILGLIEPTSGEVLYKGRRVKDWIKRDRLTYYREVQPIFQDPYSIYNPFFRVDRILKVIIRSFKLASNDEDAKRMAIEAMEDIGLRPEDILGRYPHQISGGEKQRLMLARILLLKPKLVIADEPVSMIDVSLRAAFLNQLASFKEKPRISCIYITHDLNNASYISESIMVLCHGKIVERGPTALMIKEPIHPYTKLLINSIPIPNPRKKWNERLDIASSTQTYEKLKAEHGCIFSYRCPYAKDMCRKKTPELIEVEPGREVACFLYSESQAPKS
jgi:peptide/nickel transport system ATP-binding protein